MSTIKNVTTRHGDIRMDCPGPTTIMRAETFNEKEPETLEWIDSFAPEDVLWDIGANIGCYSLYAGLRGIRTCAFEPEAGNYWMLNRNLTLNDLPGEVLAYNIAFDRTERLGVLNVTSQDVGGSLNQFGTPQDVVTEVVDLQVCSHQGMIGFSIDNFMKTFKPPRPDHLKLDVDGLESHILLGAPETLKSVSSVLVEINSKDDRLVDLITTTLHEAGLLLLEKRQAPLLAETDFASIFNYIFRR